LDPRAIYQLWREIGKASPDVVHTHLPYAQAFGRLIARLQQVASVVSTYHDVPQSFCPDSHMLAIEILTRPLDSATVGVSQGVVEEFNRRFYFKHIGSMRAIPNGVDVETLREKVQEADGEVVRQKMNLTEETVFLNVGRFSNKKRHLDIVKAMDKVLSEDDTTHLILVGSGELEASLRQKVDALGLETDVTITGHVPEVEPYYAAADVYIHAALYEGFGLTIAEAMSVGLPIIATDVPGARDVVNGAGCLVQPRSPVELSKAMAKYVDRNMQKIMRKRSVEQASNFHIDQTAAAYTELYQTLVGK
jgi:glycosyltransferase involved in cell wall biosynthesis